MISRGYRGVNYKAVTKYYESFNFGKNMSKMWGSVIPKCG